MIRVFFSLFVIAFLLFACEKDELQPDPEPIQPELDPNVIGVNKWVFDYMNENYLWNEAVANVKPDSAAYDEFLFSILNGVAAQNNVNKDDGFWLKNEMGKDERYYYSHIEETSPQAKSGKNSYTANDFGILTGLSDTNNNSLVMHIMGVKPGSSADKNNITRGHVITKVDGKAYSKYSKVEEYQFYDKMTALINGEGSGKMTIEWGEFTIDSTKEEWTWSVQNLKSAALTNTEYNTTPIWQHKILTLADKATKVGYLNYNEFYYAFDNDLIEIFSQWKTQNITNVILDLRYNGGGHVVSSAVIATALAGETYKDKVFLRSTYNQSRTEAGEIDSEYHFGNSKTPEGNYLPISSALNSALTGVTTVYVICSGHTASASEAIINGLRGVDIEVRLIGERTIGKNVGSEPQIKMFNGNSYQFSPITFYSENGKGFKDYSDGFEVDIEIDQNSYYPRDFGNPSEPLLASALLWIIDGTKPTNKSITKSAELSKLGEMVISKPRNTGLIQLDFSE